MFFVCQCLFLLFLWSPLHIFASLRRVKFICVLVSFVWRFKETVMCYPWVLIWMAVGAWAIETCRSPSAKAGVFWVFFLQQSCKWRMVPLEIFSGISQWVTFHCKPWFWKEDGGMRMTCSFFHCADKDPVAQKKRLLVSGGKIPPCTRGTQQKIREGWGVKEWCRKCQSDHVFTSVPLHQSGFPRNRYFVPYASWLYMTIRTDIENDCLDSVQCFSSHRTRDFALIDSMPTCSRGGKNTNLFTTEIWQFFPERIHIHTVSIGIP